MADLKLNRRVRIERPSASLDELNQPKGFDAVAVTWANVSGKSGKQAILADAKGEELRVSVRVRYRTDVLPGWRVVLLRFENGDPVDDAVFVVDAALPDYEGRESTDLACTGVTNG